MLAPSHSRVRVKFRLNCILPTKKVVIVCLTFMVVMTTRSLRNDAGESEQQTERLA